MAEEFANAAPIAKTLLSLLAPGHVEQLSALEKMDFAIAHCLHVRFQSFEPPMRFPELIPLVGDDNGAWISVVRQNSIAEKTLWQRTNLMSR